MDKNIIAFIRDDVSSIGVRFFKDFKNEDYTSAKRPVTLLGEDKYFNLSDKEYTYVTHLQDLKVGDLVVVVVAETPKVVIVTSVHEELAIEPNESTQYKWVVAKIDMDSYRKEMNKNQELAKLLADSYRMNMKNQFRNAILGSIDSDAQLRIASILGGKDET
jgi:hypothetical protein